MVTGPKSANRSIRNSRSMRGFPERAGEPSYHRRHCERSEAIQTAAAEALWIASSQRAPRNDGQNYPSILAGRSSTDSPQPQAEIWLGLLKTNWACILSA